MLNKIRNNKLLKYYGAENTFIISNNLFAICKYEDQIDNYTLVGGFKIYNNKITQIAYLNFTIYPLTKTAELSDIFIDEKYRHVGLGMMLISLFEERCIYYGIKDIVGKLSSVDEDGNNEIARNSFYAKNGYTIMNGKVCKTLLNN